VVNNASHMGRLGSGPHIMGHIGSGVWVSASFQQNFPQVLSCGSSRGDDIRWLLSRGFWSVIERRIVSNTFSYLNNMLKPYIPLLALHSSNMDLLTVPRADTSLGLRHFSVAEPQVPHELHQCNTLLCFKSKLKTYYFCRHMDN